MRNRPTSLMLACLLSLYVAQTVQAAQFHVLSIPRYIQCSRTMPEYYGESRSAVGMSPFLDSISFSPHPVSSNQSSAFQPGQFNVSGEAAAIAQGLVGGDNRSISRAVLTFAIDEPQFYSLNGYVAASRCFAGGDVRTAIRLQDVDGDAIAIGEVIYPRPSGPEERIDINSSGLLSPGTYILTAEAYSEGSSHYMGEFSGGSARFNMQFNMDVIPEPVTLSLLALGGLALTRRRQQR